MNQYEPLIEELIALKDSHRDELGLREIMAIDRACNVLEGMEDKCPSFEKIEETIPIEYFIKKGEE